MAPGYSSLPHLGDPLGQVSLSRLGSVVQVEVLWWRSFFKPDEIVTVDPVDQTHTALGVPPDPFENDSFGRKGFRDPEVALVLHIVTFHSQLLSLKQGILDNSSTLLVHKGQLLEGFINGHPPDHGSYIPHLEGAVFDVCLHVANKLCKEETNPNE